MIHATIYNELFTPLNDPERIDTDADFEKLEAQCKEIAGNGVTCCIRWGRDDDGQVAFWGPNGSALRPHWYRKCTADVRRNGRNRTLYLDDESFEKAARIGGSASDGVRKALAAYEEASA